MNALQSVRTRTSTTTQTHVTTIAMPGVPWEHCPRSALKKVLAAAEAKYGITFVIGQEIEFYVLEGVPRILEEPGKTRLPPPVDASVYCQAR